MTLSAGQKARMRTRTDKTTTVRILATLLRPDGGHAALLDHDVVREAAAVRRRIALAGQAATVDEDLTGRENLLFLGRLSGLSRGGARARAAGLLEAFGLQRRAVKQAARAQVWQIVRSAAESGSTVLLTT
jgi:ABC-type multidrug transport system ATPase subunit